MTGAVFPGIIRGRDGRRWTVREMKGDETPRVNMKTRTMIVPLGESEVENESRLHEMGHVTWTDPELMYRMKDLGVPELLVQAVEDARINSNLRNLGLGLTSEVLTPDNCVRLTSPRSNPAERLMVLMGTLATGDERQVRKAIAKAEGGPDLIEQVEQMMRFAGFRDEPGHIIEQEVSELFLSMLTGGGGGGDVGDGDGEGMPGDEGEPMEGSGEPQAGQNAGPPGEQEARPQEVRPQGVKPSAPPPKVDRTQFPSARPDATKTTRELWDPAKWQPTVSPKLLRPVGTTQAVTLGRAEEHTDRFGHITAEAMKKAPEALSALASALSSAAENNDGVRPVGGHLLDDGPVVKSGHKRDPHEVPSYNGWCSMRIVEPPRPDRVPARVRGRAKGVNDTGAIPIALHRATSDGRVFRATRIKPMSGSVLIDNSGSMGFTGDDLIKIMQHLPAATIADYCSKSVAGELRILAHQGRMVRKEVLYTSIGGSNGVDGPALRWLIQQKGPRFWVADGGVTGRDDMSIRYGGEECLVLCKAGKVIQLFSIGELEELLESGKLSLRRHPPLRPADQPPYRIMGAGRWLS